MIIIVLLFFILVAPVVFISFVYMMIRAIEALCYLKKEHPDVFTD